MTGNVEQRVLRGSFWPVRVFRDLKSRTKHRDAPESYPMTLLYGERVKVLERMALTLAIWPLAGRRKCLNLNGKRGG